MSTTTCTHREVAGVQGDQVLLAGWEDPHEGWNLIDQSLLYIAAKYIVYDCKRVRLQTRPNQSVHGKYNLISVRFKNISKRFLCVYYTYIFGQYNGTVSLN